MELSKADSGRPSRPTTGLVLGKFLPPHAGHLLLIDHARARVERLTVLVCSLPGEPIPGALRVRWLQALRPDVRVVPVTDENPQEPHEHPRFWEIWTETIHSTCPEPPQVLFTSEGYGDELARRLGIPHECVDRERRTAPVSGTLIRKEPAAHWGLIPEPVRPYLLKRVVVTGPESTGKTTLARRLAERYATRWVPEFARGYLDEVNAKRGAAAVCLEEDIEPIARGQLASEDARALKAERVLVCDTDLGVTKIYAEHYFGRCPAWIASAARERRYDLHLLLGVDVPWVADPQRDLSHLRREMWERFRAELVAQGRRFIEGSGSWDERFATACRAVDEVLREPLPPLPADSGGFFPGPER